MRNVWSSVFWKWKLCMHFALTQTVTLEIWLLPSLLFSVQIGCFFVTEEIYTIQYHGGLQSRKLGQRLYYDLMGVHEFSTRLTTFSSCWCRGWNPWPLDYKSNAHPLHHGEFNRGFKSSLVPMCSTCLTVRKQKHFVSFSYSLLVVSGTLYWLQNFCDFSSWQQPG